MDLGNFDATREAPISDFQVVPTGWYKLLIVDSSEKENAKKTGSYLQYDFNIVDGDHKGAPQTCRLNLNNPSEKAVEIAKRQLADLAIACGVSILSQSEQLHGKVVHAKILVDTYKKDDGSQGMSNNIKKFEKMDFVPPDLGAPAVAPTPVDNTKILKSGTNSMPWDR